MIEQEFHEFLVAALTEMRYSTEDLDDDTRLGPAGADLESLALAELAVRVEDRFGVRFDEEEMEGLAGMTIGEFRAAVAARMQPAATPGV